MDHSTSAPSTIKVTTHHQYVSPKNLSPSTVLPSPLDQFRKWFKETTVPTEGTVVAPEPEAMSLATVSAQGIPSVRVVLLREVDDTGFVFFTNYDSRKSQEMKQNAHVALAFYWKEVHRQVRVVGRVEKINNEESSAYYNSRPLGSRIGAWASKQSAVIDEGELDRNVLAVQEKFGVNAEDADGHIPRPDFWGGWRVIPQEIEFWAGQPSRLHDRVRYLRHASAVEGSEWKIERLSP